MHIVCKKYINQVSDHHKNNFSYYFLFFVISDKDIYLHPAVSTFDSGISGDIDRGVDTAAEEHTFDNIPACNMAYQSRMQSEFHHQLTDFNTDYPLPLSSIPTEEIM